MPKSNRRAFRRHQNARWLKRAKRIAKLWSLPSIDDPGWIERTARLIRDNRKPCSCHMCCNARRCGYSRGPARLTLQERRQRSR